MGIFGKSAVEQRRDQLALGEVVSPSNWRAHLKQLPELADVSREMANRSPRPANVSQVKLIAGIERAFYGEFDKYLAKMTPADVEGFRIIRNRQDYSMAMLTEYLGSCGSLGVAVNHKLQELLLERIPAALINSIAEGNFDGDTAADTHAAVQGKAPGAVSLEPLREYAGFDSLTQVFHDLIRAVGLAPSLYGAVPPQVLYGHAVAAVPQLSASEIRREDGLAFANFQLFDVCWGVFVNGNYSALVLIPTRFDGEFGGEMLRGVVKPFAQVAENLNIRSGHASQGTAERELVLTMESARSVPIELARMLDASGNR